MKNRIVLNSGRILVIYISKKISNFFIGTFIIVSVYQSADPVR